MTTTAAETTVTIAPVAGHADLHQHYRGQSAPQPCHIQLACDTGTLTAGYDAEIGSGVPSHVWHRRTLRFAIPCLTADTANALLAEVLPIAERIVAGYSREWDGSNHVGTYTADAEEAIEEMESLTDDGNFPESQKIESWDAADWYGSIGSRETIRRELGITADTTDEQVDAIEAREDKAAEARIIEGLRRYLDGLRDEAVAEREMALAD